MDRWLRQLQTDLSKRRSDLLLRGLEPVQPCGRHIERRGVKLVNLAGNDYLAIADHPALKAAAIETIESLGVGAGASRLTSGHFQVHADTESQFAAFKHAQAALLCPTGYMANLAAISALAGRGDLICVDKLNHASLLDAARASDADVRVYPHLQTQKLERLLKQHADQSADESKRPPRRFIVTDSVFSMDGDTADLPALCDLADKYDAVLMVDEAHATGVLGDTGAGLCELRGVGDRVDVVVSTASKALGGLGGIVTARQEVIDTLINHARSFIYTTAVPPAQAAVIQAALRVVQEEPWRRRRVLELANRLHAALIDMGLDTTRTRHGDTVTPILPVIVGSSQAAMNLAESLEKQGLFAPAIRPPTVAPNSARVRISLRADLEDGDITRVIEALLEWKRSQ